jgi:hypothetical protein
MQDITHFILNLCVYFHCNVYVKLFRFHREFRGLLLWRYVGVRVK